jgi:hypothetical protein
VLAVFGAASHGATAAERVEYERAIKPLLRQRCYACHGALKQKAGLRLDTGASIRRGGDGGPAVVPGHAEESLLLERVRETDRALRMPPEGSPLSEEQVAAVAAWIDQGATSPAGETPETDPREHWSFRRPVRPPIPQVSQADWVRDPIDAFLLRELERRGMRPLPPAPPHVLLRRVYLDLTGLPPSREELHAFLADPSESAYRRVVDRLLASPQYGERWARHWMDVWRYSDWYGRRAVPDVLNSYAQIWRWRDWIVRSLNEDRGYDWMVRQMLAADELAPTDDAGLVATGFLVRNWYRWNYNLWMRDNVEHTGKAFLALTFNCAHCHDHKYDPIRHEDYFALRAFFEPLELRHDRVPGEPDPGPYPKYEYGKAYGPITSGMVRVFDEKLDARTFLYTRGESRNIVPGRPPIAPGMPAFLGGGSLRVEPVSLPAEAFYPGLKAFVRREEAAPREVAVARAADALEKSRTRAAAAARALTEAEARWAPGVPRAFDDPLSAVLAFTPATPEPEPAGYGRARAEAEAARWAVRVEEAAWRAAVAERDSLRARIAADDVRYGKAAGDPERSRREAVRSERRAARDAAALVLARAERDAALAAAQPPAQKAKLEQARKAAVAAAQAALARDDGEYKRLSPVYPPRSTGRRAALAAWITDRANPLSARVAVNHLWRWHFHVPLVATTADFGRNGALPSHPELLDWLAVELMEPSEPGAAPWSMKALHRRIVTSAAYRMISHAPDADAVADAKADPAGRSLDPANRWYWRFPTARMEAEEVRDSLLHVAGGLDPALGGPDIPLTEGLKSRRRSLYFTHHGEARMTFLELFDAPDVCDAYRRTTSVVPQQALALVNNDLLLELSRSLAERLWSSAAAGGPGREDAFLTAAFEQVLTRSPSPRERAVASRFLARQAALLERGARASGAGETAAASAARARRDLVHALFSHNDFLTIH